MKLHTKLLMVLLAGIGAIYAGSQVYERTRQTALVNQLAKTNMGKAEASQWEIVENLHQAGQQAIQNFMCQGEMEKLQKFMDSQVRAWRKAPANKRLPWRKPALLWKKCPA